MGPDDHEFTPALDAARKRRMDLHEALVELEQAISAPAPGRIPDWADTVGGKLANLRDAFGEHILGTEEQFGLYEEILNLAPHLAPKVAVLREEHPTIAAAIAERIDIVTDPEALPVDESVDDIRDEIQRLLGRIIRHRQHGADLVWEAYNLDIGGMG